MPGAKLDAAHSLLSVSVRAVVMAGVERMGRQRLAVPQMKHQSRRLHDEGRGGIGCDIKIDLVRGARTGERERASEFRLDRTMHMAANDTFHLRVAFDDLGEFTWVCQTHAVHVGNSRRERRMMHEDQGRFIRRMLQARV